ncbi:MAG: hypothetical protein C5B49_14430 [Bdellovibrio sp.]|nr:MAG: hypothetical protein C5B49_14430 [Bdellovibrio sp.]
MNHRFHERGFIIPDFIFSILLASALGVLMFSVSYSLAVVEITQYVSYSIARAHLAGNKSSAAQKQKAMAKYNSLVNSRSSLSQIYKNGWFEAARPDIRGGPSADGQTFNRDLAGGSDKPSRNWFIGVSIPLNIKLLQLQLPLLGDSAPNHPNGFLTHISSMLIREVSEDECRKFMTSRGDALGQLPSGQQFYRRDAYVPLEDNGC